MENKKQEKTQTETSIKRVTLEPKHIIHAYDLPRNKSVSIRKHRLKSPIRMPEANARIISSAVKRRLSPKKRMQRSETVVNEDVIAPVSDIEMSENRSKSRRRFR